VGGISGRFFLASRYPDFGGFVSRKALFVHSNGPIHVGCMDVFSSEERPWYGRYNHEPRFAGLMTIGGVSRADEDIREGVVARIGRPAYDEAIASLAFGVRPPIEDLEDDAAPNRNLSITEE
jgi:hypothetical protein